MNVAYVEDDADARTIFAKKLAARGIACDVFGDAESAMPRLTPGAYDVWVLDIRLPGRSGLELLKRLRARHVETPCILITAFNSLEFAREALNASASYLIEKPFSFKALIQVLERVAAEPKSLQHCVDRGLAQMKLTEREDSIARLMLKGLSNAEIAEVTSISEKTVKQHVGQIFEKADVQSRAEFFAAIFPL
jgi:DNA-binding NarL/FixJ family response regulator